MSRKKLAVLGGGLGSLATVFHITEQPDWRERFDITVYQQGWRLGGKCASGRDLRDGYGARVLEHGLHLFGGFYDYSFDLLGRCYEALDRPEGHPNRRVWDAFTGLDAITLMDRLVSDDGQVTFEPWYINFESLPGRPGEVLNPPTAREMMASLVRIAGLLDPTLRAAAPEPPDESVFGALKRAIHKAVEVFEDRLIEIAEDEVFKIIADLEAHSPSSAAVGASQTSPIARLRMGIYLIQTVLHGIIFDGVLINGFDPLDQWELRDWLFRHALAVARDHKPDVPDPVAAAKALIDWPVVRGSYDYVFGYADGDIARPAQGAGTALRGFLRLACGFKGHLFYAMRGGMGDVVIAPLYLELAKRGVKFEFFSRVDKVVPGETSIEAIQIGRQAVLKAATYRPLVEVPVAGFAADKPLPCWPAEPLWDQLADADRIRRAGLDLEAPWSEAVETRVLKKGEDFDTVVLGIPVGELRRICADLPAVEPAWGDMLNRLATTRTIALQLWLERTNADMGCDEPGRTLTGNAQPLSCWADMTHILARETWWGQSRPQSIAYFCGQLPGGATSSQAEADAATAEAKELSKAWLLAQSPSQWPASLSGASNFGLDPAALHDPEGRAGEARFDAQYWRANTSPAELYVQFVPGSLPYRMRAEQSGFDNLFLCGDWTKNGLNAGAAEAAVMSGVICAKVLSGDFSAIPGEDDTPSAPPADPAIVRDGRRA